MQRLKSPVQRQSFLSVHRFIYGHLGPRLHLIAARENRHARAKAFRIWRQETYAQTAA
jgi:putative transposase